VCDLGGGRFVAVAEDLHFGRAANRLHMSQSPLLRAISDVERELGVVLLVRTTRHVELTSAGSVLLDRARRAAYEPDVSAAVARCLCLRRHVEPSLAV
jgi:DNA-binding transcriptional LysR family regulator